MKLDVVLESVADSISVLVLLPHPPISRRPAGDLQLECQYLCFWSW